MATVTVYTAARMQQIEDTAVISGSIVGDNLILETRDGTTINAGNVRGPKGDIGLTGEVSIAQLNAAISDIFPIETGDIENGAITQAKIAQGAVGPTQIQDDGVTTAALQDDAVTAVKIANNAVGTNELQDDAVNGDKIASNAINASHILENAVRSSEIQNGAVTHEKIADEAVRLNHISSTLVDEGTAQTGLNGWGGTVRWARVGDLLLWTYDGDSTNPNNDIFFTFPSSVGTLLGGIVGWSTSSRVVTTTGTGNRSLVMEQRSGVINALGFAFLTDDVGP